MTINAAFKRDLEYLGHDESIIGQFRDGGDTVDYSVRRVEGGYSVYVRRYVYIDGEADFSFSQRETFPSIGMIVEELGGI